VRLLNQQVTVQFLRVDDELKRRRQVGLGAVADRELLTVLFDLPVDLPVPRDTLTTRQLRLLRKAPDGAVELPRREITRLLVPAIRVTRVEAHGLPTTARLRQVSQFGAFAARTFVVRATPTPVTVAEAIRWGIGLKHADGRLLLAEQPFVVRRHTPATWLFHETAFAQLRRADAEFQ
jgi:hypothetical protein